jgi:hypothetical protein
MKISGTVRRPPDISIIFARNSSSSVTSISSNATPLLLSKFLARAQNGQ